MGIGLDVLAQRLNCTNCSATQQLICASFAYPFSAKQISLVCSLVDQDIQVLHVQPERIYTLSAGRC